MNQLTKEEKGRMEFVINHLIENIGIEKAAKFLSGFKTSRDFLDVLGRDVELLTLPECPFAPKAKPEDDDRGILSLPELKF